MAFDAKLGKIIKDHKIQVRNREGLFNLGSDMVFHFLEEKADVKEIQTAMHNAMHDSRFYTNVDGKQVHTPAGAALGRYMRERYKEAQIIEKNKFNP